MIKTTLYFLLIAGAMFSSSAGIIGTNSPSLPITDERIAALPKKEQAAWKAYLATSEKQMKADRSFLFDEMKRHGIKQTSAPPKGNSKNRPPLGKAAAWYGEPEALRMADIVCSFQTPAGGWSKGLNFSDHLRAPGECFAGPGGSSHLMEFDNDLPRDLGWSYVGTFDNGATTTQLRFLAKVMATNPKQIKTYRAAFLHGLEYIFHAQTPNGGWPQVWPLEGGYHDAITFNDGAMINVLRLLRDVSEGAKEFEFVASSTRKVAAERVQRGIECILASQIAVDGHRTVWCQQHDAITLQPASARNYEMPSKCGSESSDIMLFLMELPNPDERIVTAVHNAAAWLNKTEIRDFTYKSVGDEGRELVAETGAEPIWARYHDIASDRPIFGDRDKSIHAEVRELSKERRNGYGWFSTKPIRALNQYASWNELHPNSVSRQ